MAAQRGIPSSAVRVLEEALGMGLTAAGDARDTADAVAAEGAYYLERILPVEARLVRCRVMGVGRKARASHWGRLLSLGATLRRRLCWTSRRCFCHRSLPESHSLNFSPLVAQGVPYLLEELGDLPRPHT